MGKVNKKGIADKVRNRKKNRAKPQSNPFEVKINKVKHTVVNKKVQKWEKGTPGLSRSKAVKKRQDTLLREMHHMKKSNSLHDKRFGESDSNLTADEKMVQRFALEKKKQMQKGDFSLNDEEETLTHYGQSLAENLQDTIGSDSEEEDGGTIRTGDLQFGGFAKSGEEVSWKDKMKEVIADSKKQKYERQVEKEKTMEATSELDGKWKSVIYKFQPLKREAGRKGLSSYLQLFHNLVLEQKSAGGTDKLKTEEETAKTEAEKLQKLEAERLARMNGIEEKPERTHVSADDLSDCFALDKNVKKPVRSAGEQESDSENDDNEASDEEEKDELTDVEGDGEKEDVEDSKEGVEEEDSNEEEDEEEDESDNYSDLASGDDSGSEDEEEEDTEKKNVVSKPQVSTNTSKGSNSKKTDLPFVFSAPGSFEELEALLHGHDGEEQAIILSRLRKCHHPSLAEGNKEKLQSIHLYTLQYFGKLVSQPHIDKTLVGHISTCLWETMQMFKDATASALQKYITQRQAEFVTSSQKRKGRGSFPSTETLMHLALIENLFPASDFRHPVCTPTLHFMTQILSECPVKDGRDVVCGLFLSSLALKFVKLSKRYVPELVTFLHGILVAAANMKDKLKCATFPPFRTASKSADLLVLENKCNTAVLSEKWSISEMMGKSKEDLESDQFKCEAIKFCLDLLVECLALWSDLPCLHLVMQPLLEPLTSMNTGHYPASLQEKVDSLKSSIEASASVKLKVMQQPSMKPEPLRLFEPKIEEFWSGKRKKGGPNKQANERQRLNHKYKREMKAAVREIKRDNEVLAKHQLDVVMKKDQERKRKTKELMHSLASQEGDYKAIKRMKH